MEAAESQVPTTRTPLSKERVLQAAVDLADREGIDALSMRRLAKDIGVEAMSLYNHVANKDEILVGMIDRVTSEVEDPSTEGGLDWKTAIRRSAISTHDAFIRHRWSCPLMMKTAALIPSFSACCAASSDRCTSAPHVKTTTSVPSRFTAALPNGLMYSAPGYSALL